jgi:hypothetical protein
MRIRTDAEFAKCKTCAAVSDVEKAATIVCRQLQDQPFIARNHCEAVTTSIFIMAKT